MNTRSGHEPARHGQRRIRRELVEQANPAGFFWGGHSSSRKDGMRFEIGRPGD